MDAFVIHGGKRLRGTHRVNGSKNACLPLMAAALLADQPVTLTNVPNLSDIGNMFRLLESLGVETTRDPQARSVVCRIIDPSVIEAHYDIVRTMRAGICVLGPLLASRGKARVSMPGGCAIGDRPVDLHIRGLQQLGARITLDEGYIVAETPKGGRLIGTHVFMGGPNGSTVLGTANVLSAAVLAKGTTMIECAACEPEIEDLATMLTAMGAKISGAGSPRIVVEGVASLGGCEHAVMPDRIEAGTYVLASAITNGEVTLHDFPTRHLMALLDRLNEVGVSVELDHDKNSQANSIFAGGGGERDTVRISAQRHLKPVRVVTQPHPGFPTDLQAQMMALLCLADGNSVVTEKIFQDRFMHVPELQRMGAEMSRSGPSVIVSGVRELIGAPVMASDLRASAGLVLAGLAARGTTVVNRVYHLDRGYETMEVSLRELGADIQRVDDADL